MSYKQRYSTDTDWKRSSFANETHPDEDIGYRPVNHPISSRSLNDISRSRSTPRDPWNRPSMNWPYSTDHVSKEQGRYLGVTTPQGTLDRKYRVDQITGNGQPSSISTDSDLVAEDDDTHPKRSFVNILTRFADRTSCVGPSYINSSNRFYSKGFWILLFLAMTSLTIWNVTENFITYYNWPKKTTVSIGYKALPFPTLTVCNTNAVRVSGLALGSEDLQEFVSYLNPKAFERPVPTSQSQSGNQPNGQSGNQPNGQSGNQPNGQSGNGRKKRFVDKNQRTQNFNKSFGPPKLDFEISPDLGGETSPQFQTLIEFQYLIGLENSSTRFEMGHHMQEMLLLCSFEGRTCEADNFTTFLSEDYGNCFSFNQLDIGKGHKKIRKSFRRGSEYGLQLILFLEVDEYLPGLAKGYGMRASISHPETMAFPSTDGMFVSAGTETDIGIRLVDITRLGQPYDSCSDDSQFKNQYGFRYTKPACQAVCPHRSILRLCGCYDGSIERLYPRKTAENYNACMSEQEYECMANVNSKFFGNGDLKCNCPNPCTESTYDALISTREWPEEGYLHALIDSVCRFPDSGPTCQNMLKKTETQKRRNFLKMNVFYRDLNFESLSEEPDYPQSQFASDLGGSVGLWLGLSVLSLFEVFGLLVEIVVWLCRKLAKSSSKGKKEQTKGEKEQKENGEPRKTSKASDLRKCVNPNTNFSPLPGDVNYRQQAPYS